MKGKTVQPVKTERWWLYIIAAITVFFILCFENNGSYYTEKVVGLLGAVAVLCGLLFADKQRVKRLLTPPAFAVFAYMLLAGISTLYSRSGKFANSQFASLLAAFAVFIIIVV